MEAIAATDGCVNPIACSGFLEDTTAGMPAARRRLAEIRRLKTLSNSGNFSDIVKKRSRTLNGQLCSVCFGEEVAATDAASVNTMEIEVHSQTLYPARRLVRSVSTPISWKGGLFCTCSLEKFWSKDNIAKQNSTGNLAKEINTTKNNVPVSENPSSNKNNSSKSDVNNNTSPTVTSEAEPMVQDLSPQAEVMVNNPACEMQQTKTVRVDDEGSKVKMQIPPTPRTPPLPLPSASCPAVSSSVDGPKQPNSEESVAAHISRPLKAISRANSESISLLLKDPCPPHGTMSVIGRRREMEDAVSAVPSFFSISSLSKSNSGVSQNGLSGLPTPPTPTLLHFFGVYDGHGGSQASIFCKNRFHEALAEELRNVPSFSRDANDWNKVMSACFMKMDIAVGGMCPNGDCGNGDAQMISDCCQDPVAPENVGSTAVIAVVSPSQFVIANCGDSRAVLCRGGRAIQLSNDHKPEREDELSRIEAAGGRVIFWNGHRVGGFLAMSRAIGDRFLKRYVISEPEVTCIERTHEDECLILASDGLWDVLSNDTVCEVARKCLAGYRPHRSKGITEDTPVGAAAALLTKLALGRGSGDNISVIVIDLKERRNRNR